MSTGLLRPGPAAFLLKVQIHSIVVERGMPSSAAHLSCQLTLCILCDKSRRRLQVSNTELCCSAASARCMPGMQSRQNEAKKKLKCCFLCSLFFAGAVLIDQYCNPLSDICLRSVQAQVDDITDKVRKVLRAKNPRHPSLAAKAGTVQKRPLLQSFPAPLHS